MGEGEEEDGDGEGGEGADADGVGASTGGFEGEAEDFEGGDVADGGEGEEGEEEADEEAGGGGFGEGDPGGADIDREGDEIGEHAGEQELEGDTGEGTEGGADEAEDEALEEVDTEGGGGGATETTEDGDGGDSLFDVDLNGAGDADTAEEEGDEADEVEEVVEVLEGLTEVFLAFGDGGGGEAELVQAGSVLIDQLGGVGVWGQADEGAIAGEAAGLEEAGGLEIRHADEDTRGDGGEGEGFAGDLMEGADDVGIEVSDAEAVADPGVELGEERFFDEGAAGGAEAWVGVGGGGFEVAVEGEVALESADLGEAGAVLVGEPDHGGEGDFAGLIASEGEDEGFVIGGEADAGAEGEVGAEEGAGFGLDAEFEGAAEGADGDEGGDSDDDAGDEEEEATSTGSTIAPGHAEEEAERHLGGEFGWGGGGVKRGIGKGW